MASTALYRACADLDIAVRKVMNLAALTKPASPPVAIAAVKQAMTDLEKAVTTYGALVDDGDMTVLLSVPATVRAVPTPGPRVTAATAAKQMEGMPAPKVLTDAQKAAQVAALNAQIKAITG